MEFYQVHKILCLFFPFSICPHWVLLFAAFHYQPLGHILSKEQPPNYLLLDSALISIIILTFSIMSWWREADRPICTWHANFSPTPRWWIKINGRTPDPLVSSSEGRVSQHPLTNSTTTLLTNTQVLIYFIFLQKLSCYLLIKKNYFYW